MPVLVAPKAAAHDADDRELVAAVRHGDDRAFEVLYGRYHPRIAAYVRGMVRDHGRAEDVTQDVFISALRRMRDTERDIAFKPWVYEIAKNACIDAFRRSRRADEVSMDAEETLAADPGWLADTTRSPDTAMAAKQQLDDLCGAFGGLSEAHHEILVMRELEGLSYREIGERLGMTRPSVESTLFRARRRLSEEYEELVTGERCRRVQSIIATAGGRAVGARDQRRLARHISHCQPCRRHACLAGVAARDPATSVGARIAALLPLPAFLRRRWGGEDGLLGTQGSTNVAQWSANVAGAVDPSAVAGWGKAVVAAATVAIAGVGAGAAITERHAVDDLVSRTPIARGPHPVGAAGASATNAQPAARAGRAGAPDRITPAAAGPDARVPRDTRRGRLGAGGGTGTGSGTGEGAPGAERSGGGGGGVTSARPRAQPPTLKDVTDRLGLAAPAPAAGGGAGAEAKTPADETPERPRPIRDLLESTLGSGGSTGAKAPPAPTPGAGAGTTPPGAPTGADGDVAPPATGPAPTVPSAPPGPKAAGGGLVGTVVSSLGATVDAVAGAVAGR